MQINFRAILQWFQSGLLNQPTFAREQEVADWSRCMMSCAGKMKTRMIVAGVSSDFVPWSKWVCQRRC